MKKLFILLLSSCAYLTAMDASKERLYLQLVKAVSSGDMQQAEQLLNEGVDDVNAIINGRTLLMNAAMNDDIGICELLVAKGADINKKNIRDNTALMVAAGSGSERICQFLISKGADVNAENSASQTALMLSAKSNYIVKDKICKLLIKEMIKPTKEQVNSVVALLGISKKHQSEQLNLIGRDVVKLIGREKLNEFKRINRSKVREQIAQIKDEALKKNLLQYLDSIR